MLFFPDATHTCILNTPTPTTPHTHTPFLCSQSELSEQHEDKLGDESLFAVLDDDFGTTSDDGLAASSSDVLLLGTKTDEDLILEMEEFI